MERSNNVIQENIFVKRIITVCGWMDKDNPPIGVSQLIVVYSDT